MYLQELQMFNFELKLKERLDELLEIDIYNFFIFSFQFKCYPYIVTMFM